MRGFIWFLVLLVLVAAAGAGVYGKMQYDIHMAEMARLKEEVARMTKERDQERTARNDTQKLALDAQSNLKATTAELAELRRQREESEKRLEAFKVLAVRFQKMIDTGKLKVIMRGGRMVVKLPSEVLFASGSADLSPSGQAALAEVSAVLKEDAARRVMVSGHTDNLPIGDSKYKNNWELSTARALTVTEYLIKVGMKPENLVAAGYSEYDPVSKAKTAEGLQENRRIELVLMPPTMDDVPGLLEQASSAKGATSATAAPRAP
jgi:chemotaxis protein MotB